MVDTDRLKELSRLTSIYTAGKIFISLIGFLLYPIYTSYLTPSQFGTIGLALLVGGGVQHVFSLGTRGAAFNFYHRYEGRAREEFYTSLFVFTFVVSVCVVALLELVGPTLFRWLLGVDLYDPYFRIIIMSSAVVTVFKTIPEQHLKAGENARGAVFLNSGQSLVNHAASLVAVVGLSMGVVGYLLGSLVAAAAAGVAGTVYLLRSTVLSFSISKIKAALTYSLPLFPHFYSHFIISMADRVLLTRLGTLGAVGVYTLGYSLAKVLELTVTSGNNAIMPEFAAASDGDEAFDRLGIIATYYVLLAAVLSVGFSLFMPVAVEIFFPAEYQDAIGILPWLAGAFFCLALYYVPMNVLSQTQRETRYIPVLTLVAAASNIGLNYLLIPGYGIVGAAAATLAAYLLLAASVFVLTQWIQPIDYEYRRISILGFALLTTIGLGMAIPDFGTTGEIAARASLLGLFVVILTGLGFWTREEIAVVRQRSQDVLDNL